MASSLAVSRRRCSRNDLCARGQTASACHLDVHPRGRRRDASSARTLLAITPQPACRSTWNVLRRGVVRRFTSLLHNHPRWRLRRAQRRHHTRMTLASARCAGQKRARGGRASLAGVGNGRCLRCRRRVEEKPASKRHITFFREQRGLLFTV